ncbi:sucrose-6F-phosphate phosphohydrolase-domain-containing protein [Scenedesmus sp. NREL 46B-D3]|nr:sucrose-6F-phosphate phosphohydrolase-domain-containing protein [Scenedesmus sp. NREL 46B-D3]
MYRIICSCHHPLLMHRRTIPERHFSSTPASKLHRAKMSRCAADGQHPTAPITEQAALRTAAAAIMPATAVGVRLSRPLLLVSDLDDTLLPCKLPQQPQHEQAAAAFKEVWNRSRSLGMSCKFVINTGRTLPLFEEAWAGQGARLMPQPDAVVTGVGTRIHLNTAQGWQEDAAWTARMNEGWDSAAAKAAMDAVVKRFGASSVVYREAVEMHEHKLTVLYKADLQLQLLPLLQQRLQQAGLQAIVIEGNSAGPWRFIDLLPQHAGKGSAMLHVMHRYSFDAASTVAAGDSANDLLMLKQAALSIIVGNSAPEVKAWAASQPHQQPHPHPHQQQQQQQQQQHGEAKQHGPKVYAAHAPVAAGVLEGLQALGFLQH